MPRQRLFAFGALAVLALGFLALVALRPARGDAVDPRRALAISIGLFDKGNATAARSWAFKATRARSGWGLAQAMLARADLALGEGAAAEAAIDRARGAGFAPARLHHLRAEALLQQGKPERALAEARQAPPRYARYAARVAALALAARGRLPDAQGLLARELQAVNGADAADWVALARVRRQTGDVGGAIDAAGRALALNARDADALTLRAELVRGQYGLVAALPWFEAALKIDPWRHDTLIGYAATLGDAGRYRAMLAATRRALAVQPGSPQALYLQAVMAARAGNDDLARALLERTGGGLDGQAGPLLLAGVLDYRQGAYQQAITRWRAVVAQAPMNLAARELLGAALLKGGDAHGALEVLRPVALRLDADSYALELVGRAFEATGERDWAARFLDRAAFAGRGGAAQFGIDDGLDFLKADLDRDPANPVLRVGYLRGLLFQGQAPAALAEAERIAGAYPGAPQAHLLVGDVLMAMGKPAPAAAAYARAANLRFDEPTMLRAVEALEAAGQPDKAAATVALFLSQNPGNVAARRLAAHWQIARGAWDAAIDTLEGLRAELGDRDAALLAELARAYSGDGDDETAEIFAAAAYRLAPMNAAVADAYGWVLYQGDDVSGGVELMRKAVAIAPAHGALRWHLAQAEADAGDTRAARGDIAAALADPGFRDGAAARALDADLARG